MSLMIDTLTSGAIPGSPARPPLLALLRRFQQGCWLRSACKAAAAAVLMTLLVSPANAGIWGSPKFTMKQSDDRFTTDGTTTISSNGNRVSKRSIAGGKHIDQQGVYLDPSAVMDVKTGELKRLSFYFSNITQRESGIGALNSLGRPLRVSFLTGAGAPIVLPVEFTKTETGQTHCYSAMCITPILEDGLITLSLAQYRELMTATSLVIKVEGTDRSHIYEAGDVAPTFTQNLTAFYNAHLADAK